MATNAAPLAIGSTVTVTGTSYAATVALASCNAANQTCVAPWGCLNNKNFGMGDIGYGIGVGSPYQIDIFQLCSPSNPLTVSVYPCSVLSASVIVSAGIGGSSILIIIGFLLLSRIAKLPKLSEETMKFDWAGRFSKLSSRIQDGSTELAAGCLRRVLIFGFFWFCVLFVTFTLRQRVDLTDGIRIGGAFLMAVVLLAAALTVSIGMYSGVLNHFVKTVQEKGMREGLRASFEASCGGAFLTTGVALLGLCGAYLFLTLDLNDPSSSGYPTVKAASLPATSGTEYFAYGNRCRTAGNGSFCGQILSLQSLCGFALGISFVTMMLRSITGIFSKAAEVGDELVDKLENTTIDQQDNPAQGLDFVGNLAVEVVGQSSDFAESLILSILACAFLAQGDSMRMTFPFWIAGFGLFAALFGQGMVFCKLNLQTFDERYVSLATAFKQGLYLTILLDTVFFAVTVGILSPTNFPFDSGMNSPSLLGADAGAWRYFAVCVIGLMSGLLIWESTSYFTSHRADPTRSVAASGVTGVATHLIQGFGVGMFSCLPTLLILTVDIISCHAIASQYGVALSAVAMVTPLAFAVAANSFAPIAFAGSSIVCGTDAPNDLKDLLAPLDMIGMSNVAEVRGWSIACAIKASLAVLMAFKDEAGLQHNVDLFRIIDGVSILVQNNLNQVTNPQDVGMNRGGIEGDVIGEGIVFGAAILGAFVPLMCAGINVLAVGKATRAIVDDSRIQMRNRSYKMDQSVYAALYPSTMGAALPVVWAITLPAFIGFLIGPRVLLGLLAGGILSSGLMSVFCINTGSTWAKSEASIAYEGILGGADSEAHRASWIATRLGGVLRDVAGPTAVTMMKTMAMTALTIAPLIFIDKDIFATTLDGNSRRPPANELTLYTCSSNQNWWDDNYMSGYYYASCVTARSTTVSGSVLSCFDWNKAYWSGVPAAIFLGFTTLVFFFFWREVILPLNLPDTPVTLLLQQQPPPSFEMKPPPQDYFPIQTTQMVPMQVRSELAPAPTSYQMIQPVQVQQPMQMIQQPSQFLQQPQVQMIQQPMQMMQQPVQFVQQPVQYVQDPGRYNA